jgi:Domain of unknown function (DUF4280)
MPFQVCLGAALQCSFCATPSNLVVLPTNRVLTENKPAANIMDYVPMVNIMPFGMCMSPSNPTVAAATAAAMGVLTPMPCIPVVVAPWTPGSPTVLIANMPALNNTSTCMCSWGGLIMITYPGQATVQIP